MYLIFSFSGTKIGFNAVHKIKILGMISSKIHAALDYIVGILLIAAPWLLGFADKTAATLIPVILGASTIIYSLFTNYEYSLVRLIPYKIHLTIDFIAGLLLLVSPWLFGFSDRVYLPHAILGAFEIIAVMLSRKATDNSIHRTRQV